MDLYSKLPKGEISFSSSQKIYGRAQIWGYFFFAVFFFARKTSYQ